MKRQDARDAREQEEPSQKLDRDFSGAWVQTGYMGDELDRAHG